MGNQHREFLCYLLQSPWPLGLVHCAADYLKHFNSTKLSKCDFPPSFLPVYLPRRPSSSIPRPVKSESKQGNLFRTTPKPLIKISSLGKILSRMTYFFFFHCHHAQLRTAIQPDTDETYTNHNFREESLNILDISGTYITG